MSWILYTFYVGLLGLGLFLGLQFVYAAVLVLIAGIMVICQWIAKQFRDDQ